MSEQANHDNRKLPTTRPMGPLEQGDQAIVDALEGIEPSFPGEIPLPDVQRIDSTHGTIAMAAFTQLDTYKKHATIRVDPDGISAMLTDSRQPEGMSLGHTQKPEGKTKRLHASAGNVVWNSETNLDSQDRLKAQRIKLEAARRIQRVQRAQRR